MTMTDTVVQRGPLWGHTAASQQRRRDILLAGKKVFFEHGYALASIDRIAEVAGTTKRTVYDHFGSKDALFAEVIAFASEQFVALLPSADALPTPLAEGLRLFVGQLKEWVTRPDSVRFQRLVIAEAERHPQFGQVLYETAVLGAEQVLADYLRARIADGQAPEQDADRTARLILDLTINGARVRALMAVEGYEADETALELALGLVMGGAGQV
jgi:TetR/AcrR family transcriptional regulator, mexJK operon transcriptional repressor